MSLGRLISLVPLLVAISLGTLSDVPHTHAPISLDSYRVLTADFHVHSFPLSWGTLAPWDTVLEARHDGLDVIAMTPHNHVWIAYIGRWFSERIGGPTVLIGEEIVTPRYHLLAIGIHDEIGWRQSAAGAIDEVHRQGGVAIAAHPRKFYWPAYDAAALSKLDGAEIQHPLIYATTRGYGEVQQFFDRAQLAAIGDSDYHGTGPMGICRTFIFAHDNSEGAILDAIRTHHTVAIDRDGRAYGDPTLIALMKDVNLAEMNPSFVDPGWMVRASAACGLLGLLALFLFGET
jgi:predicted metal-dependent phosphoesterase TrpH